MEEFHIWDLERVNIKINNTFLNKINKEIKLKFKSKLEGYSKTFSDKLIPFTTFKNILKPSYLKDFFVPLGVYAKICKFLEIKKEELEKNIVSYKTAGGINYIENPILPIVINPVFDMLLAHHIGDGTVVNPGKGRLPYFGYRQFDEFYRISFVRKLEYIFGKIKYKKDYFLETTRPYCPPVLSSLFFKYYCLDVRGFISDTARIPEIVYQKGKESMLAVLIAFIIDEGNIDSTQITINLKNPLLIKDISKICDRLVYKFIITQSEKERSTGYSRLHILREGMKKFYEDYKDLNKKYPIIHLGWKGEKISNSFKIYSRKIYKTEGNSNLIFELLKKEQLSVNQLSERINMTRQGVRFHVHNLLKEGKIKLINNKELNWIYGV